jgi:hypothetical protein
MYRNKAQEDLVQACLAWARAEDWNPKQGLEILRRTEPVLVAKADVGGSVLGDFGSIQAIMNGLWIPFYETSPAVFDIIRPFTRQGNFIDNVSISSAAISVGLIGEASAIPVARFTRNAFRIAAYKVSVIAVLANELKMSPEAIRNLTTDFLQGCADGTDTQMCTLLTANAAASFAASSDASGDLKKLADQVNVHPGGNFFFILGPQAANYLASVRSGAAGNLHFPDAGLKSGSIFGVEMLVTLGAGDSVFLADCSGLATASSPAEISTSPNASIEMESAPAMDLDPTSPSGKLVSSFVVDATAFKVQRAFGLTVVRPSSVAVLSDLSSSWDIGTEVES